MVDRPFQPLFWSLAQLGSRTKANAPADLTAGVERLPAPATERVPTRHGTVRVLVQRPVVGTPGAPVVMHMHGGGFVNRYPEQDLHIARHLAVESGVTVVLPDYDTAPRVQCPVTEEQMLDVARWVQTGAGQDWDIAALALSGVSAGAKLAIDVCQQLHAAGLPGQQAIALVVPVIDVTRTDRTSSIRRPAISPLVQRFVGWAYFPDVARRREPLASPLFDDTLAGVLPPTLILTGADDTLAPEGAALAAALRAAGTSVEHHEYPDADHDFIAGRDRVVISDALGRMATFFGTSGMRNMPR
ncbi:MULTISPECIES: alpha/beta hydrolase fold domain-containing protein [Curtobacterium]|uniref:alpha/beta hydrolase n=1 Tax=Curtobacterium flaccumfaciens TaxID=2035 RepID=UPI003EE7789C